MFFFNNLVLRKIRASSGHGYPDFKFICKYCSFMKLIKYFPSDIIQKGYIYFFNYATLYTWVFRFFRYFFKKFVKFSIVNNLVLRKIHASSGHGYPDFKIINKYRRFIKLIINFPCDITQMGHIRFFEIFYNFSRNMRFSSLLNLEKFLGRLITVPPILKSFAIIVFVKAVARFYSFT